MVDINKFIEKYIDLIDHDRWADIYNIFNMEVSDDGETGDFTRILLNVGIDPIRQGKLNYIPFAYMYVGDDTNPQDISIIEYEIPEGVLHVMDYAFWGNKQLKKIVIPKSIRTVRQHAFGNCPNLTTIEYKGSWEDWRAADTIKMNYDFLGTNEIICSDGTYNRFTGNRIR